MTNAARAQGQRGEALAAAYLVARGYHIVARNFRYRRTEVDLIAQRDQQLLFVEVKARSSTAYGTPETFVTDAQAERVVQAADHYLHQHGWEGQIRFDVVAIHFLPGGGHRLHHFEDAFY